jgi:hypothetical protein
MASLTSWRCHVRSQRSVLVCQTTFIADHLLTDTVKTGPAASSEKSYYASSFDNSTNVFRSTTVRVQYVEQVCHCHALVEPMLNWCRRRRI